MASEPDGAFSCDDFAGLRRETATVDQSAGRHVLIAAPSGRALACAARRAGFIPLVADMFGDDDVRALASCRVIPGGVSSRFEAETLIPLLEDLEEECGEPALGVVYGGGFEDRPQLLRALAMRWPLLGAAPEAVERVKDPERLAATLAVLGVPHPEIRLSRPKFPSGWLMKRQGGGGGGHVHDASSGVIPEGRVYYQRWIEGRPVSALFVASPERGCVTLGFSDQWTAPCHAYPYRYGGAARPASIDEEMMADMAAAVRKTAREFGLAGLGSADFIVNGAAWSLIEINPRPGATLDIFDCDETPLLALHIAAIGGVLPTRAPALTGAAAAQVVYMDRDVESVAYSDWPDWLADRPSLGVSLQQDDPFCTVRAQAPTADGARRLSRERAAEAMAMLHQQKNTSGMERKRTWRKAS
jgi:predicted ATP-grasp superfamily ATP-dependent carboligase